MNAALEITLWLGLWAAFGWVLLGVNLRNLAAYISYGLYGGQLDTFNKHEDRDAVLKHVTDFAGAVKLLADGRKALGSTIVPCGIVAALLWIGLAGMWVFSEVSTPQAWVTSIFFAASVLLSRRFFKSKSTLTISTFGLEMYVGHKRVELERLNGLLDQARKYENGEAEDKQELTEVEKFILAGAIDGLNSTISNVTDDIKRVSQTVQKLREVAKQ